MLCVGCWCCWLVYVVCVVDDDLLFVLMYAVVCWGLLCVVWVRLCVITCIDGVCSSLLFAVDCCCCVIIVECCMDGCLLFCSLFMFAVVSVRLSEFLLSLCIVGGVAV